MTEEEYNEKFRILKLQENMEKDPYRRKETTNQLRKLESTYKQSTIRKNALDSMFQDADKTMELHDTELGGMTK